MDFCHAHDNNRLPETLWNKVKALSNTWLQFKNISFIIIKYLFIVTSKIHGTKYAGDNIQFVLGMSLQTTKRKAKHLNGWLLTSEWQIRGLCDVVTRQKNSVIIVWL